MQAYQGTSGGASSARTQLFKIDKATHPQPEVRQQAKVALARIDSGILALQSHALFDYLRQRARVGFTAQQFCVHGRGYLEACRQVIPLFEMAAQRAQAQGDLSSLRILKENLNEEYGMLPGGMQNEDKVHTTLASFSHHTHAKQVFGVEAERFEATLINPAVTQYIERQRAIYGDHSYHAVIGACYVDEKGSVGMMAEYFNTFFIPYRDRYPSPALFDGVAEYWHAHLDELEMVHAKDIRRALLAHCGTTDDVNAMQRGCDSLLAEQMRLLDGALAALVEAERVGQPVATSATTVQIAALV